MKKSPFMDLGSLAHNIFPLVSGNQSSIPLAETPNYITIWICLLELPTEYYDLQILQKIGNTIGTILKINSCTRNASRGRYARLCILTPLNKLLSPNVLIGSHLQKILFERTTPLGQLCGCLGHNIHYCTKNNSDNSIGNLGNFNTANTQRKKKIDEKNEGKN